MMGDGLAGVMAGLRPRWRLSECQAPAPQEVGL